MERLASWSSKDGRMVYFTSSKKDLGVVTPLVTAERVPSFRMRRLLSCQGLLRISAFF